MLFAMLRHSRQACMHWGYSLSLHSLNCTHSAAGFSSPFSNPHSFSANSNNSYNHPRQQLWDWLIEYDSELRNLSQGEKKGELILLEYLYFSFVRIPMNRTWRLGALYTLDDYCGGRPKFKGDTIVRVGKMTVAHNTYLTLNQPERAAFADDGQGELSPTQAPYLIFYQPREDKLKHWNGINYTYPA